MEIINREASDKYKGFRYQKLRLAKKMFDLLGKNKDAYIIGFPEYKDDSYILGESDTQILEQNKEYTNNFTFNSEEVRKAIVNFLDIYFEYRKDPNLVFAFHTNVQFSKERTSELMLELGLMPLEEAVIKYIIDRKYTEQLIDFVSKMMIKTYEDAYKESEAIHLDKIKDMKYKDWCYFLDCIYFEFGQPSLEKLEDDLIIDIKSCPFYGELHIGREMDLKNAILELIDIRMKETSVLKKALNSDNLKNVYLELSNKEKSLPIDPVYTVWDEIVKEKEESNDVRNLREKIESVCDDFDSRSLSRLNLEATTAKGEITRLDKKQINSLKVRVYESMGRYFDEKYEFKKSYDYNELKEHIRQIKEDVVEEVSDLKSDYSYGLKNKRVLEKVVMMLIDECFYAFDKEPNYE